MVRLSKTEHFIIEGKANKAGLKISDWFRQSAKAAKVSPRISPEDLRYSGCLLEWRTMRAKTKINKLDMRNKISKLILNKEIIEMLDSIQVGQTNGGFTYSLSLGSYCKNSKSFGAETAEECSAHPPHVVDEQESIEP